jgi:hypothetical protein
MTAKKPKGLLKGKILQCEFKTEWENPKTKSILYVHEIVVDNGYKGQVMTIEKMSPRIAVDNFIEFEYDFITDKIKLHSSSTDRSVSYSKPGEKSSEKSEAKTSTYKLPPSARKENYIGYAWSYAKDLLIAGKTMKDIEELDEMATYIYERIGKQLKGE